MRMIDLDLKDSKILVVDDVPANLDVLVEALDREGYNVLVASNGTTALEVAAYARPDLILLDVMMPGIDGFETCRRLQADHNLEDTPVIFLTARDDIEGIVEGFEAGGLDYITKPFKKEEVLLRVRTHLERTLLARNLAELNAHLEQKVAERTREVQLRLKELEGKDRIAQHLLTFNTLEETLAVVLEVITNILKLDSAAVFLRENGELQATAAIGVTDPGAIIGRSELTKLAFEPNAAAAQSIEQKSATMVKDADLPTALVPILRDEDVLGLIQVENHQSKRDITDADLKTLTSFALQSAVAITDAQVRQDPEAWRDQLDEILEIEEELEDSEGLDGLSAAEED